MILATSAQAQTDSQTPTSQPTASIDPALGNLSLEELMNVQIVVAAGRREQTQRQAAASVSVVSADEINLMGYRNLAEILRNQRSFYLHTDGLNWFAGVRGLLRPGEWNARMLVLVDGRPTRENIYGATQLDQDFVLPVEAYKRVEIIRGPGSALYGGNAVFSVVNVITKDGADLNGGLVRVQGGNEGTARAVALYGFEKDDWDIIGGASAFTSHGDNSIQYDGIGGVENNFGRIEGWDQENVFSGYLKIRRGPFTLMLDHADRSRDNRSATYVGSFYEPGTQYETRTNATLHFDHEVAKGQSLHAMVYYGRYSYRQNIGYTVDPSSGPETSVYFSRADDDWIGGEIHYNWQVHPQFHLLAGAEGNVSLSSAQNDSDAFGLGLNIEESFNSWGFFTEGSWRVTDRLTLVAGGRYDHVQDVGGLISPRFAAIADITDADTLKLLYGRAFRAPNQFELFYENPGFYASNPGLKSEVVDTYEAVWERRHKSGWNTSVGAFLWRMSDTLDDVSLPDDRSQVQNVGTVEAHGIELEMSRRWESGGSFRAYSTFTQTEDPNGDRLAVSPEWIAGAAIIVPFIRRHTFISLDMQAVGSMKSDLGDSTDPSFLTNIVLTSRRFLGVENLEFQAGVYNLFADDARLPHGDAFQHAQPTLNWPGVRGIVGLTYRF